MEEETGNFSVYRRNNLIIIKNNKSLNVNNFCLEINTLDFTPSMNEERENLGNKITDCQGIIGIITLKDDSYVIVIKEAKLVCTISKKEIYKVLDTSFIRFTQDEDEENSEEKKENESENNLLDEKNDIEIINQLKDIFKNGFYFSNKYDLANSLTSQNQINCFYQKKKKLLSDYDYIVEGNKNFLSNWKLTDNVMTLPDKKNIKYYFSNCIYGNIEEFKYEKQNIEIILISRRYLWNYGTFDYRRGLSKYGGNSNQIETELILIHDNKEVYSNIHLSSYIPIYFKSKKNIDMTDANKAFVKYFKSLIDEYNILFLFLIKTKDEEDKYKTKLKNMLIQNAKILSNKWKFYNINKNEETIKTIFDKMKKSIIEYLGFTVLNKHIQFDNNVKQLGIISLLGIDDKIVNKNQLILIYETIYHILSYMNKGSKIDLFLDNNNKIYDEEIKDDNTDMQTEEMKGNENGEKKSDCYKESLIFIKSLKEILKKRQEELYKQYYTNYDDEESKKKQRAYELLFGKNMKYSPLKNNLNSLREQFSDLENIKIYVGNWNTASTEINRIKKINLDSWLLPKDTKLIPDIYFIGFQEIVELNTTNVIMKNEEKQQEILDEWDKKINESIQKIGKYVKLVNMNLVGINFYFYILDNKFDKVRNISKKIVKTGLRGATGNKGSCCITFEYENTSISIACSHLAAGNKNKQRLKELDYILNLKLNTFFNSDLYTLDMIIQNIEEEMMPSEEENKNNINNQQKLLPGEMNLNNIITNDDSTLFKDSDIWIFFGDLNFRVDMEYEEFSQYLKKGSSWNKLLDFDQFNKFKLASIESMEYIQEDEITFPPTYKYIIDSDEYDYTPENVSSFNQNQNQNENIKKSGKKRNPSWCDRIFYKKNSYVFKDGKKMITGLEYNNVMNENFQSSDHRPIYHIFDAIIFKENEDKRSIIEREIIANEEMGISSRYMKKKNYDY